MIAEIIKDLALPIALAALKKICKSLLEKLRLRSKKIDVDEMVY